jgi:hypothetical protein
MSENKEKITPLKNSEDYEKLKTDYQDKIKEKQEEVEKWKSTAIKSDKESLAKDKIIEKLETERDSWKEEACAVRKVQQESKQVKEQQDFDTELKKLQAKKGLVWDENQETWIAINPNN